MAVEPAYLGLGPFAFPQATRPFLLVGFAFPVLTPKTGTGVVWGGEANPSRGGEIDWQGDSGDATWGGS